MAGRYSWQAPLRWSSSQTSSNARVFVAPAMWRENRLPERQCENLGNPRKCRGFGHALHLRYGGTRRKAVESEVAEGKALKKETRQHAPPRQTCCYRFPRPGGLQDRLRHDDPRPASRRLPRGISVWERQQVPQQEEKLGIRERVGQFQRLLSEHGTKAFTRSHACPPSCASTSNSLSLAASLALRQTRTFTPCEEASRNASMTRCQSAHKQPCRFAWKPRGSRRRRSFPGPRWDHSGSSQLRRRGRAIERNWILSQASHRAGLPAGQRRHDDRRRAQARLRGLRARA
jgi:hypothetical protein